MPPIDPVDIDPADLQALADALHRPDEEPRQAETASAELIGGVAEGLVEVGVEVATEIASAVAHAALEVLAGVADGVG